MQYKVEFSMDKVIIAAVEVEAKSHQEAQMIAAKLIKTVTKQNG